MNLNIVAIVAVIMFLVCGFVIYKAKSKSTVITRFLGWLNATIELYLNSIYMLIPLILLGLSLIISYYKGDMSFKLQEAAEKLMIERGLAISFAGFSHTMLVILQYVATLASTAAFVSNGWLRMGLVLNNTLNDSDKNDILLGKRSFWFKRIRGRYVPNPLFLIPAILLIAVHLMLVDTNIYLYYGIMVMTGIISLTVVYGAHSIEIKGADPAHYHVFLFSVITILVVYGADMYNDASNSIALTSAIQKQEINIMEAKRAEMRDKSSKAVSYLDKIELEQYVNEEKFKKLLDDKLMFVHENQQRLFLIQTIITIIMIILDILGAAFGSVHKQSIVVEASAVLGTTVDDPPNTPTVPNSKPSNWRGATTEITGI